MPPPHPSHRRRCQRHRRPRQQPRGHHQLMDHLQPAHTPPAHTPPLQLAPTHQPAAAATRRREVVPTPLPQSVPLILPALLAGQPTAPPMRLPPAWETARHPAVPLRLAAHSPHKAPLVRPRVLLAAATAGAPFYASSCASQPSMHRPIPFNVLICLPLPMSTAPDEAPAPAPGSQMCMAE